MTRWKAFLVVLLAWALIYLPGLGSRQLKGEECRRILPAIHMLKTGQWIVPVVAGRHYYNKPPGINWLVAASFALSGRRTELTARLPSALFVLALAAALVLMRSAWLGVRGGLVAAIVFLTNIGMYEKGRLIEIEGVYVCLAGLAILWWLNVWSAEGSRWLMWLPPSVLLGFGALVKGPFLAVPFYCTVVLVLLYARKIKELISLQHTAGIAVILVLCLGWVCLAYSRTPAERMTQAWSGQLLLRVHPGTSDLGKWALNVLKSPIYFLPWLIFLPLLWVGRLRPLVPDRHRALFEALRLALIVSFIVLSVAPGSRSRYCMPVLPLACMLIGWILSVHRSPVPSDRAWNLGLLVCLLTGCALSVAALLMVTHSGSAWAAAALAAAAAVVVVRVRRRLEGGVRLALATGLVFVVGVMESAALSAPFAQALEWRRPAGRRSTNGSRSARRCTPTAPAISRSCSTSANRCGTWWRPSRSARRSATCSCRSSPSAAPRSGIGWRCGARGRWGPSSRRRRSRFVCWSCLRPMGVRRQRVRGSARRRPEACPLLQRPWPSRESYSPVIV